MKIALTGATGLAGRALLTELRGDGHQVVTLGRNGADLAFDLAAEPPALGGFDALIHAGFAHLPGKYRGGEGDDPETFTQLNRDGTLRLFRRAKADGLPRIIFLSSRAVYGSYPAGTPLVESLRPRPDTLYGDVKQQVEDALPDFAPTTITLRPTGLYGPGPGHKWAPLFAEFRAGHPIAPRVGTEVHMDDLSQAVRLALSLLGHHIFNLSDLVLDRHDLLGAVARLTGCPHAPPPPSDASCLSVMDCTRIRRLGWAPGGWPLLDHSLPSLLD